MGFRIWQESPLFTVWWELCKRENFFQVIYCTLGLSGSVSYRRTRRTMGPKEAPWREYLGPGRFIDSDHPLVVEFSRRVVGPLGAADPSPAKAASI